MQVVLRVAPQQVERDVFAVDRDRDGDAVNLGLPGAADLFDFEHRLDGLAFAVEIDAPAALDAVLLRIEAVETILCEVEFLRELQPGAVDLRHPRGDRLRVRRVRQHGLLEETDIVDIALETAGRHQHLAGDGVVEHVVDGLGVPQDLFVAREILHDLRVLCDIGALPGLVLVGIGQRQLDGADVCGCARAGLAPGDEREIHPARRLRRAEQHADRGKRQNHTDILP